MMKDTRSRANKYVDTLLDKLKPYNLESCKYCDEAIAEYRELSDEEVEKHAKILHLTPDFNSFGNLMYIHIGIHDLESVNLKEPEDA